MAQEKLWKTGDIQVGLFDPTQNAISFPSDDDAEVAMFRQAAGEAGIRRFVRQAEGQQVAAFMLQGLAETDDPTVRLYVGRFLGMGELGSSWHSYAEDAPDRFDEPIDRRTAGYARLDTGDPSVPPSEDIVLPRTTNAVKDGVTATQLVMGAAVLAPNKLLRAERSAGRTLGHAAWWLGVLANPGGLRCYGPEVTDVNAQHYAKFCAQSLKARARHFTRTTGENPAISAFAPNNRDSELARELRRQSDKKTRELYDAGIASKLLGIEQFFN